jgi:hypothetical protein
MNSPADARKRNVYFSNSLLRFIESGRVRARSDSARLAQLADRYNILIREAFPKRTEFTPPDLLLLSELVRETDISDPTNVMVLSIKAQQVAERGASIAGVDPASVAFRLKTLKAAEMLAVVDWVERFISQHPDPTREDAAAYLQAPR